MTHTSAHNATQHAQPGTATISFLIGVGGLFVFVGFLIHPDEGTNLQEAFAVLQANAGLWALSHWLITAGCLAFAAAGLAWIAQGPRGPEAVIGALITIGAILTLPTVFIESTIAPAAARAGDFEAFATAEAVASSFLAGFVVLLVASAVMLVAEAASRPIPRVVLFLGAASLAVAALGIAGTYIMGISSLHILVMGAIPGYAIAAWCGFRVAYNASRASKATHRAAPA